MTRQLSLLEVRPSWRLDDATREAGRRGVAEARAALQAAMAAARAAESERASQEHPSHRRSAA
jgi:hypothetical protein